MANANLAQQDVQSKQQLAQFQAEYGLNRDANARANIATQDSLGQQQRAVDAEQRQAPVTALGKQIEMFSGLPLSMFHGTTTDANGSSNGSSTESGVSTGELLNAAVQAFAARH